MFIDSRTLQPAKIDLSGAVAPRPLPLPDMPASVWTKPDVLRSEFHLKAHRFYECESVLAVTGTESGISGLSRLFQTWYGSMRVVLAEPCFDQWDLRFRRASHVVLDWPVEEILEGELPECDVVILSRPVNPTGEMISIEQAKKLAHRLRNDGGWLILDEAYIDWMDVESYCAFIEDVPAIVLRSMGVFSGLSGANIAFVCGPKTVCQALLEELGTQAVSAPQWWLALEFFRNESWRREQLQDLAQQMQRLESLWANLASSKGAECKAAGYCITLEHPEAGTWAHLLERKGVLVRHFLLSEERQLLRCAIPKNEQEWQKLTTALGILN